MRDRVTSEPDAAARARADLEARLVDLSSERDSLGLERDKAITERDTLAAGRDALIAERNAANSKGQIVRVRLISLEATHALLQEDHNRLTAKHGQVASENRDLVRLTKVFQSEIERLGVELTTLTTQVNLVIGQRDDAIVERNELRQRLIVAERQAGLNVAALRSACRREFELLFERRLLKSAHPGVQTNQMTIWLPRKARLNLARRAARARNWAAAELWYASILRHQPNAWRLLVQYGHALNEQSAHELAAVAYSRAITISGPDADLVAHLIDGLRSIGVPEEDFASWGAPDASWSPLDARPIPP